MWSIRRALANIGDVLAFGVSEIIYFISKYYYKYHWNSSNYRRICYKDKFSDLDIHRDYDGIYHCHRCPLSRDLECYENSKHFEFAQHILHHVIYGHMVHQYVFLYYHSIAKELQLQWYPKAYQLQWYPKAYQLQWYPKAYIDSGRNRKMTIMAF